MCIRDSLRPVEVVAQELPVQMIKALLGERGPPPGLQPPDCRPGPKPTADFKDDPHSDIVLGFFKA
eukprot:9693933-Alexandrium_andersonii.AAC.1